MFRTHSLLSTCPAALVLAAGASPRGSGIKAIEAVVGAHFLRIGAGGQNPQHQRVL